MSHHNLWLARNTDIAILTIEALLSHLCADARLVEAHRLWSDRIAEEVMREHARQPTATVEAVMAAALYQDIDGDLRAIQRCVDGLGDLRAMEYPWLPPLLLDLFRYTALDVDDVRFAWPAPSVREPGESYRAYLARLKAEGPSPTKRSDIDRDVRWFYRRKVLQEQVTVLANEYARDAGRVTDSRSVVQAGIKRVHGTLTDIRLL